MDEPIVIVGGGLAGYQSAKEIRRLDGQVPICLISSDGADFYSKPMLSNAFASGKTPDSLILKRASEMASEIGIEVIHERKVDAIHPESREISTGEGRMGYSKLVLALGADPIRLPVEGEMYSVNDLLDYRKFRQALAGKRRIAILGAGLIGCEFANDLLSAGFEVDVFDIASQPLGRLVPPECGEWIMKRMKGVGWHFNASVTRFEEGRVHLADGSSHAADVLLSAVGLVPRTKLALDAGLACGRGIRVNEFLQTSVGDIHAIGDCMEFEGMVLPFVMPIMHASKALASNILGKEMKLAFPPMPVVVKTPLAPTVVCPPKPGLDGAWHTEGGEEGMKSLFLGEEGKMLGFCLCGKAVSEKNALARTLG